MAVASPPEPALSSALVDGTASVPSRGRSVVGLLLGAATLVVMFVLAIAVGSVRIPVGEVVHALLGYDMARETWRTIVLDIRLPRTITAALAGAALGVGGLQMQTLFRNPLADPFILGISAGASLGVALVVLVTGAGGATLLSGLGFAGNVGVSVAAALGAAGVMAFVLAIANKVRSVATLLIIELMIGYATSGVVSLLVHTGAGGTDRLRAFLTWNFGSFRGTTWSELRVFVPVLVVGLLVAAAGAKPLNALLLGEGYAASMGVAVQRVRVLIIVTASVLAGVVTAFCGPIAFVGVAVPHLARSALRTSDHRVLVPACVLFGGVVALVAELIAQVPGRETVLPLNAVTSMVGAPVVVFVLLRHRRASRAVVA